MTSKTLTRIRDSVLRKAANQQIPDSELHLTLEPLESRLMLSGNVLAAFVGSDVILTGDELDNNIELSVANGNIVLVSNESTTINGSNGDFVVSDSSSFDGRVVVRLHDGNDQFVVQDGLTLNSSLTILAGRGDDAIGVGDSTIVGALRVITFTGDDSIALQATDGNSTFLITGSGEDTISVVDSNIGGRLVASTGSGADNIVLDSSNIARNTFVHAAGGDDNILFQIR